MKKRILLFLLSFVLFTAVFASCGRGEEVCWIELELSGNKNFIALDQEDIQRELFKKYHVCSKENEAVFGVQFHPEYLAHYSDFASRLFDYFIEKAKAYHR